VQRRKKIQKWQSRIGEKKGSKKQKEVTDRVVEWSAKRLRGGGERQPAEEKKSFWSTTYLKTERVSLHMEINLLEAAHDTTNLETSRRRWEWNTAGDAVTWTKKKRKK